MPELPEVETTVRALRGPLVGRTLMGVRCTWPRHVVRPSVAELQERVAGRRIEAIDRRGKFLVFRLGDGQTLLIHLRMTGHLSVVAHHEPQDEHTHTVFLLDDGRELRFRDTRKFGTVHLLRDAGEVLGKLGPEPLADSFTAAALRERLAGRTRQLKPLLLDQTFIAGVGNIYADEALYYARLHPQRTADSLNAAEAAALHAALRKVLKMGIEREGASIDRYVKPDGSRGEMQDVVAVFQRTGAACYECGAPIERIVLGGRSTHFCPICQPLEVRGQNAR